MKKLLAIVMVAAMVLSMSVIASAAYETTYSADITYADGRATIIVSVDKVDAVGIGVVYPDEAKPLAANLASAFKTLTQSEDEFGTPLYSWSNVANTAAKDEAGHNFATIQGAGYVDDGSGDPITVDGPAFQFVFECPEGTEFTVVEKTAGVADVTAADNVIATVTAEAPAPVVTDTPAPVVTDTPAPTEDLGTATETPKTTDAPKTTVAPNGSGSAPKTADVAPIATMITLVVIAGAALVVLKKRVTE